MACAGCSHLFRVLRIVWRMSIPAETVRCSQCGLWFSQVPMREDIRKIFEDLIGVRPVICHGCDESTARPHVDDPDYRRDAKRNGDFDE